MDPFGPPEPKESRLVRKAKEAPFMVIGLAGLLGVVGYSIYGYRKRTLPTSLYIIHTRVVGQGTVVVCCTLGIAYSMFSEYILPKFNSSNDKSNSDEV